MIWVCRIRRYRCCRVWPSPCSTPSWGCQLRAWQLAFIVVGLPGILLALLVTSLREPQRKGLLKARPGDRLNSIPLRQVVAFLGSHRRTYIGNLLGVSLFIMLSYAILAWTPAFFIRKYGWTAGEIGVAYGTVLLIFGTSGVVSAGWLAEALRRRGYTDANLRLIMFAAMCAMPFAIAAPLVGNAWLALALMAPMTFFLSLPHGIGPAALQPITPNQMRAQVSALYLLCVSLVGLGIGPTLVALLTDYVYGKPTLIGYSLATVAVVAAPLSILVIGRSLKFYRRSLAAAERGWIGPERVDV